MAAEFVGLHFPVQREFSVDGKKAGDIMPDGSIYVGTIKDRPVFTTPEDEGRPLSFREAFEGALEKRTCGRSDWRVPRSEELHAMFASSAIKGFTADRPEKYWGIGKVTISEEPEDYEAFCEEERERCCATSVEDEYRAHVRYVRGSRLKTYLFQNR